MHSAAIVHPTALVEDGAQVGAGCSIRAYAFIGRHCVLGENVVVHPFAALGGDPQDLSFDPKIASRVHIGARTVIREHVTVNRATQPDGATEIGADCFLMAASHVAHDCRVGERVVLANCALLGGHVQVGDRAFIGGGAVVHQHCRIGESAMIGGGARITLDVPSFCLAAERNALIGLNLVGLRRRGVDSGALRELKRAFQAVQVPVGNSRERAQQQLQSRAFASAEARRFLEFFQGGRKSFARVRRGHGNSEGTGHD